MTDHRTPRFNVLAIAGAIVALAVGAPPVPAAAPLDQSVAYQQNPAHDGTAAGVVLDTPLQQRWMKSLPGGVSYPLVVNGVVYVTYASGSGTTLAALDAATGDALWSHPLGGPYPWSGVAYDRGRVFAVNVSGLLTAFDAVSGSVDWSRQLPGQYMFSSPPTAKDGIVYDSGAGSGGTLYATRESNGRLLWTAPVANGDHSSPAVDGHNVYVTYPDNYYAFDRIDGTSSWLTALGGDGGGGRTAVVADGHVFVRDWANTARILSVADGSTEGPLGATTAPAVSSGVLYELDGSGLSAVSSDGLSSGLWSFSGDGHLVSAPLVAGGLVWVGSSQGHLYAVDPVTGVQAWSTTVGAAISAPDEQNVSQPLTGLGAGNDTLVVPAGSTLVAYVSVPGMGKPTNVTVPSVDGEPRVGEQLAADIGSWSNAPTSYTFRWQRCAADGQSCSDIGATGANYAAQADDVDATLRVGVIATNNKGDSAEVFSAATTSVRGPVPALVTPPSVTGTARVGETLSADPGVWSVGPLAYAYQWLRCAQYGGCSEIPGATDATYDIGDADAGSTIVVAVTATNANGSSDPADSAPTDPVAWPPPVEEGAPTVDGIASVGETLTVDVGWWSNYPTDYLVQWQRCGSDGSGCDDVPEETFQDYELGPDDVGHRMRAVVVAENASGASDPAVSQPTDIVTAPPSPPPVNVRRPVIAGQLQQGATVTTDLGDWTGEPEFYSVQWLRCLGSACTPIAGAVDASYVLSAADVGRTLRVRVSATNPAGTSPGATSNPTGTVVAAPTPPVQPPPLPGSSSPSGNALPTVHVARHVALGALRRHGLHIRVHCPGACRLSAVLTIKRTLAGRASRQLSKAGTVSIVIRVKSSRVGALRRGRNLTLATSVTGGGRTRVFRRVVTVA